MKPRVMNRYKPMTYEEKVNAVYIGRPSIWGNPFVIGPDGTRPEVIEKYRQKVMSDPEFIKKIKEHLKGKNLICFCAPLSCHGDVLLKIANEN